MSRPKGTKNKPKVGPFNPDQLQEEFDKVFPKPDAEIKQEAAEKHQREEAKYQTTPMSNWALENRKRKLGLKD